MITHTMSSVTQNNHFPSNFAWMQRCARFFLPVVCLFAFGQNVMCSNREVLVNPIMSTLLFSIFESFVRSQTHERIWPTGTIPQQPAGYIHCWRNFKTFRSMSFSVFIFFSPTLSVSLSDLRTWPSNTHIHRMTYKDDIVCWTNWL